MDVNEMMSAAVDNAAVVVPVLTKAYEKSVSCKMEIGFTKELAKPMAPIRTEKGHTPKGPAGLITAGLVDAD